MKYKLIKNFPFFITFVILMIFAGKSTFDVIDDYNDVRRTEQELKDMCASNPIYSNSEYCNTVLQQNTETDFLTIFSTTIMEKFNNMNYIFIVAILIPTLIYICNFFKYNQLTNESTRTKYHNIMKKLFLNSYKSIFIIPLVILICILYTKTFEINYSLTSDYIIWLPSTISNPFVFISLYILNLFIHSILYINICLCIAKKNHNLFIAIILSFLTIIGIEAVLEIIIGTLFLGVLLHSDLALIFNIINFFAFNDRYGIGVCIIVPFIFMIGSFFVLYLMYKNKEKLIIDCEKNDWEGEKS